MKSRDMQIAEAVREAAYAAVKREDHRCEALAAVDDIDLSAIIASVETPEPYCWVVSGCSATFYGEFAENDAKQEAKRIGGTCEAIPLYKSPPTTEINMQLLGALKQCAKTIAWNCFGDCRAIDSGAILSVADSYQLALTAITAAEKELK